MDFGRFSDGSSPLSLTCNEVSKMKVNRKISAGNPGNAAFQRIPGAARTVLGLAILMLALKIPSALFLLVQPSGIPGLVPEAGNSFAFIVILCWLFSSIVLLYKRHWIGAASTILLVIQSALGSIGIMSQGYIYWGAWQMANSLTCLALITAAILQKTFSIKHHTVQDEPTWSDRND